MTRSLAVAALLALPAVAPAQSVTLVPYGPPVLGGRAVTGPPIGSGANALFPVLTPTIPRFSVGGGSLSSPPQVWFPSGPWGGVNYAWPEQPFVAVQTITPQPASTTRAPLAGILTAWGGGAVRSNATLVLEFPAAAEVRVSERTQDGDPATEWVLTSPPLAAGESHTFEVKARWKVGDRTYEVTRSVTVPAGERNRVVIVSGTSVDE